MSSIFCSLIYMFASPIPGLPLTSPIHVFVSQSSASSFTLCDKNRWSRPTAKGIDSREQNCRRALSPSCRLYEPEARLPISELATGNGCPTRLRNAKLGAVTMEETARAIASKLRQHGHIAY